MTPHPVATVPGSTPNTLIRRSNGFVSLQAVDPRTSPFTCRSRAEPLPFFLWDVGVRPHTLPVVVVVQLFEQLQNVLSVLPSYGHGILRYHRDFGAGHGDTRGVDRCLHFFKFLRGGHHFEDRIGIRYVVGTGVERNLDQALFIDAALLNGNQPALVEHPRHAAGSTHVAAILFEDSAQFGDGAIAIVGERVRHDRDAAWAVTFVLDLFVVDALELTGAAF